MTDHGIDCRVYRLANHDVVEPVGELDCFTMTGVEELLYRLPVRPRASVVVDLSGVTFFDCAALHMLARARQRVVESGGAFDVVCPGPWPRRILRLSGLLDVFAPAFSLGELVEPAELVELIEAMGPIGPVGPAASAGRADRAERVDHG